MLTAPARGPVTHFESALGPDGPQTPITSRPSDLRPAQDHRQTGLWPDQRGTGPGSVPVTGVGEGRR